MEPQNPYFRCSDLLVLLYYIQINEIQKYIDEITWIFPKVIFSLVTSKVLFHFRENNNFWVTSAFS